MGLEPDYVGDVLGGMILTGIGVGLTLPTFMSTAASSLPAPSFATGSAVVNMIRQIGLAIGVAVLVAVIAVPPDSGRLAAFQRGWWVMAAIAGGHRPRPRPCCDGRHRLGHHDKATAAHGSAYGWRR